jgi:predicted ATP-grasp superfamily ATP-dependent carboligase
MIAELREADVTTPAVVLKLDPNMLHHGGLGVIRSLGRLGVPVYGVHEGRWAPAASSRYLAGRVFWQPPPDDADRIIAGLLELAGRIGRPAVLLPTDDAGAIFLAERGGRLRDSFLFPDPPAELPRQLAGKYSLFQLCRDRGVPSPKAMLAWSAGEAAGFAATAGFPVIGKLTTPWRAAGWHDRPPLRSTTIIHDRAELAEVWLRCTEAGLGLMIQEYLPGGPAQDWFFHGYCDAAGRCQPAFTGVKDRSYPAYAGLTSLGRAVPNTELREQLTGLLGALGFRGIVDLDLRFDPRDGQYKLLDFNPRLGAQFRLFEDTAGVDVARAAYLDLTGQPMAGQAMVAARRFLVENYDPLGAAGYWRAGQLGLTSWAASLRRVDELAWFARDDLRPFGLMCLRMGWRAVRRPWTRGSPAQPRAAGGPRYLPGRGLKGRSPATRGAPQACSRRAGVRREAAIWGSRGVVLPEYGGETA